MTNKEALLYCKISHVAYGQGYDLGDFKLTGRFSNAATDTQGIFGTAYGDRLVLAFRGSETTGATDWITDIKFMPTTFHYIKTPSLSIHAGFLEAYQSVREAMFQAAKDSPHKLVVCTGHSLGASLATLCALDIRCNLNKTASCYTYGSPKVGGPEFVKFYNQQVPETHRYVNGADLVPSIPPDVPFLMDYEHVGQLHHIGNTQASSLSADAVQAHLPANYTKVLEALA